MTTLLRTPAKRAVMPADSAVCRVEGIRRSSPEGLMTRATSAACGDTVSVTDYWTLAGPYVRHMWNLVGRSGLTGARRSRLASRCRMS
jgi:hypothetical protein